MIAGILLGAASAATAVLIADTQQTQIDRRFDAQRSSHVMIQAQRPGTSGFHEEATASFLDLPPVTSGGELSIWREAVAVAVNPYAPPQQVPLVAAEPGGLEASNTTTAAGLSFSAIDAKPGTPLVWVGARLARRLGVDSTEPASVQVLKRTYSVAGVVENRGGFEYLNTSVVMSSEVARKRFGTGNSVRFLAKVRPGSADAVGEFALAALDPQRQQQLVDVTQPDGERLQSNVARDMRRVGIGLGLFVGLVGMVAIANTLTMAVHQRSRELGLRSAMGWTRRQIGSVILLESAISGLIASIMGNALGLLAAYVWAVSQGWQLIINPMLPPVIIGAGTLFSVVGGIGPAYRAATVSPLTAIRS